MLAQKPSTDFSIPLDFLRREAARYATEYPDVNKMWRYGGVHPLDTDPIINPITGKSENPWNNVGIHCTAVGLGTEIIAKHVIGTASEIREAIKRALTHDVTQKIVKSMGSEAGHTLEFESTIAQRLIASGVINEGSEETNRIIALSLQNSNELMGRASHTQLLKLNSVYEITLNTQISSSILIPRLVDEFTTSPLPGSEETRTFFVPVETRTVMGNFPIRYPLMYKNGVAFSHEGGATFVDDAVKTSPNATFPIIKTHADLQRILANQIALFLLESTDSKNTPQDAQQYWVNLICDGVREKMKKLSVIPSTSPSPRAESAS